LKVSNLFLRTLTAIVLILCVFAGVFYLSPFAFLICSALIFLLAGWEWSLLSGIKDLKLRGLYVLLMGVVMYASLTIPLKTILILGVLLWVLMFLNLVQYSPYFIKLSGIIALTVSWSGINYLCFLSPHPWKLIQLFLIVWLSDTAAYFAGRAFGKHKLAPSISPNKTIEGVIGAVIMVSLLSVFMFQSFKGVGISLLTLIACVLGDLFESSLKRRENLKDSGKLLPGHGGILDRIDGLIAAVPVFALGVYYWNI
jgi:phosphatidate cytidylyltransferase